MYKTTAGALVIVILLLAGIYFLGDRLVKNDRESLPDQPVSFVCADSKGFLATFSADLVQLALSDGRSLDLPRAVSASGARYAKEDESFVFWNKGDQAFIQENGNETYSDCTEDGAAGEMTETDIRPTNFVEMGTVVYNTPGLDKDQPYLAYEEPGRPGLYKRLFFDTVSWCGTPEGGTQCLAMSTDRPFVGQRVVVEGILEGETVVIRKLQSLRDGVPPLLPGPGSIFIAWTEAVDIIKTCRATMVVETHALDVYIDLADGQKVRTVEPASGEVFTVLEEAQATCGQIPIGME